MDLFTLFALPLLSDVAMLSDIVKAPFREPSQSMLPSIEAGQTIWCKRVNPNSSIGYLHGQVIVFRSRNLNDVLFVKRVVAIGGERIKIAQNKVSLNSQDFSYEYLGDVNVDVLPNDPIEYRHYRETNSHGISYEIFQAKEAPTQRDFKEVKVPKDEIFVMGDNRDVSADSRHASVFTAMANIKTSDIVAKCDLTKSKSQ